MVFISNATLGPLRFTKTSALGGQFYVAVSNCTGSSISIQRLAFAYGNWDTTPAACSSAFRVSATTALASLLAIASWLAQQIQHLNIAAVAGSTRW